MILQLMRKISAVQPWFDEIVMARGELSGTKPSDSSLNQTLP